MNVSDTKRLEIKFTKDDFCTLFPHLCDQCFSGVNNTRKATQSGILVDYRENRTNAPNLNILERAIGFQDVFGGDAHGTKSMKNRLVKATHSSEFREDLDVLIECPARRNEGKLACRGLLSPLSLIGGENVRILYTLQPAYRYNAAWDEDVFSSICESGDRFGMVLAAEAAPRSGDLIPAIHVSETGTHQSSLSSHQNLQHGV